jgi:hypothetical protein
LKRDADGANANSSVALNVDRDLYICLLRGNTMNDLPPNLFLDNSQLFLVVRFYRADTQEWLRLQPDQRITFAPHALTADEVAHLYNEGHGDQFTPPAPPAQGLMAHGQCETELIFCSLDGLSGKTPVRLKPRPRRPSATNHQSSHVMVSSATAG